jgi:Ankyrin repeats (many copies)
VDQELHHELRPHGVEHYRRQAKSLLRAARVGDAVARLRAQDALGDRARERFVLADALHVIAVEHGYASWPAFKRSIEAQAVSDARLVGRISASPSATYAGWAERLLDTARRGEPDAVARLRERVPRLTDDDAIVAHATLADARVCLAREYGFRTWSELADAADRAHDTHYSRLPAESPWKRAEAAIRGGDAAQLGELLERHPGLEREDPGSTLLCAAAQPEAGAVPREVVDVLIEAGSELDVPLNIAACFDKPDLVGWLLDAGADPTAVPIWGITPLQTATYHGAREAVDVLVARTGLHPDAFYIAAAADDLQRLAVWFDDEGRLAPDAMRERPNLSDVGWPPRPPARDDPGDVIAEALSLAAQLGRVRACEELLDRGADPSRAPLYGITPLHFAASANRRETVELLIRRGAPLDAHDRLHDGTPLGWAIHNGVTDNALLELLRE